MQLSSLKKRGTLRGPLFITFLGKFRVVVRVVSCRKKAHFTFDFPQVTCVYINKKSTYLRYLSQIRTSQKWS